MMLADAINMPLVAVLGLFTFGPLTLLVTAVESLVFRVCLKTRFRRVFVPVLLANIWSTLAGVFVWMFQDGIIAAAGIRESIPAFAHGYRGVALLLIGLYFAKSVLVEAVCLVERRSRNRIERGRGAVVLTVLLANMCSYLIVGPLFYVTTRPHFGGLETTFDASWTANPDSVIYYIDRHDQFIKRKHLADVAVETLVPFPAVAFMISGDESTVAYLDPAGSLYGYRRGASEPTLVRTSDRSFSGAVSIAPDNRRIAYVDCPDDATRRPGDAKWELVVFDLDTGERATIAAPVVLRWSPPIVWSATGDIVYTWYA
ncbi:MAG: hypothetical protein JXO22_04215, partial [Phycisphaerae bacterium]|nr:hypothetical protein [Phycisphaerae bacterium]